MKKFLLIIVAVIGFGLSAKAQCRWSIDGNGSTGDGYYLQLVYTNDCGSTINLTITYEIKYKAHYCDDDEWAYKKEIVRVSLYANKAGASLGIGYYQPTFKQECTTRYRILDIQED